MRILVDIFGGDNSPHEIVKGCVDALGADGGFSILMCGMEDEIRAELNKYKFDASRVDILPAKTVITNDDSPLDAVMEMTDSSLVVGLNALNDDESINAMISTGSTGAVFAGGIAYIRRIRGILRPTLAAILPKRSGGDVCIADCGANVDSTAEQLLQFALLAKCYVNCVYDISNPRIALLSVGTEDSKGNELTKQAFGLIKESGVNFVGNIEARDALSGDYDVVVSDGFAGNVLIKSVEGTASMITGWLKGAFKHSIITKLAALLMGGQLKKMKQAMNYHNRGGAPFLGLNKILIKAHGSARAESIASAVVQARKMHQNGLIESIANNVAKKK